MKIWENILCRFSPTFRKIYRMEEKLNNINNKSDRINERLEGINNKLDGSHGKLDGLYFNSDRINERLEGINNKLDGSHGKLDGLYFNSDNINRKIDSIYPDLCLEKVAPFLESINNENNYKLKDDSILMDIVIPTHSRLDLLEETLESLRNQTSRQFKVIISDDTESEIERDYIKNMCENILLQSKIKYEYIFTKYSIGQVANTNQGLSYTKNRYIRILHSDDILHPKTIEFEINIMNNYKDKISCLYHMNIPFSEKIPDIDRSEKSSIEFLTYENVVINFLHSGTAVPSGIVFTKNILSNIGYMNNNFKRACDWEFFYRLVKYSKLNDLYVLKVSPKFLFYRIHSYSNTNNKKYFLINFFEYKSISKTIQNDMKMFSIREDIINLFIDRANNYRYLRFLNEIKKLSIEELNSNKDIIFSIILDNDLCENNNYDNK